MNTGQTMSLPLRCDPGHVQIAGHEDYFIATITSQSPAKLVPRIEDSLEELDQLEDAIEAIGQVTKAMDSSVRVKLLDPPLKVNIFTVTRKLQQGGAAHHMDDD